MLLVVLGFTVLLHGSFPLCLQVPKVYWEFSTSEVLVLEYCPGTKINDGAALDAQGLDRQKLARLSVESYLQQILTHGFFHAGRDSEGRGTAGSTAVHCSLCWQHATPHRD